MHLVTTTLICLGLSLIQLVHTVIDITDGLIAHFTFNDNYMNHTYWTEVSADTSGNSNTAFVPLGSQVTLTADRFGECCSITGDYMDAPTNGIPVRPGLLNGDRTMTAWFRQDSPGVILSIGTFKDWSSCTYTICRDNEQFAFDTNNILRGGGD
eukprot:873086_1